jgi:hypothetical protein
MTKARVRDAAASVRARLLNLARRANKPYDEVLIQYALERFLFRLSRSPYKGRFLLKGGLLLMGRGFPRARPTRDIDFLGLMSSDLEAVSRTVRTIGELLFEDGYGFRFLKNDPGDSHAGIQL